MANVTYDDRSFLIGGERVFLVSGSLHYFRVPSAHWRDRLLKARRGGLNCVSTYLAWNVHEPREGEWAFEGDQDVVAFVRAAADVGLYVILRAGPYIGGHWDFGGLPPWLTTKTGMSYRTNSAAYTHYFDKFFRQVLNRLAEHQVTRDGNIVLIQNENAYDITTMPDRLAYLEFVSQLFRRSGFDIPIITQNELTDPPVPDSVECVAGGRDIVQRLKSLQLHHPGSPWVAIEYHTGSVDAWGCEHEAPSPEEVARGAMTVLGCGAQLNYYMIHGGTNFAFWGSRLSDSNASFETTSYDYNAPIAEGGGLTDAWYLCRLPNMLGEHMGPFLADCTAPEPGATVHDSTAVMNLAGPRGSWAFVTNNGRDDIETVRIALPEGIELTVPMGLLGAAAIPHDLELTDEVRLDYANLTPLGLFGEKVLVLHGPAGWEARLSLNGERIAAKVPANDDVELIESHDLRIAVIRSELAMRTWFVDDLLLFGPDFVGESSDEITHHRGAKQYIQLPIEGKLSRRKCPAAEAGSKESPPKLKQWKRLAVCTEPADASLEWTPIDRPTPVDKLGMHYGYVWYRRTWSEPRTRKAKLFLPDCEDRATLYLNGELLGIWGRGEEATREPLPASLKRGDNALVVLLDNLGRAHSGHRLGEEKGLFGPVYEAKPLKVRKPKLRSLEKFPRRVLPRGLAHLAGELERLPTWALDVDLSLTKVSPVHLSFTQVPHHLAVMCNERPLGFFPCKDLNYGDLTLTAGLKKGKNLLRLLLWGDVTEDVGERFGLHSLLGTVSDDCSWGIRPWTMPESDGPVVGKDQPAWYASHFPAPRSDQPLFVHVAGARKGQLFLNGHNVGRFWTIGPQEYYYLPACWLEEEDNELLLFVEQGDLPRRTRLEFRPQGPYRP